MKKKIMRLILALIATLMLVSVWRGPIAVVQAEPFTGPEIGVRWLIEPQFDFDIVVNFYGGIAAVEMLEDYGWIHVLGYINTRGEIVIPIDYRHYEPHYFYRGAPRFTYGAGGIYCMTRQGVAFFDVTGRQLTDFIFTEAYDFSEGLSAARLGSWEEGPGGDWVDNTSWGFIDTRGNAAIPFDFDYAGPFSEGLAPVLRADRWGFIDRQGNEVIPFMFERHFDWVFETTPVFSEGRAAVFQEDRNHPHWNEWNESSVGEWGFIDRDGAMLTSFMFSNARPFSEGRAAVSIGTWGENQWGDWIDNTRWGFIDLTGNVAVQLQYNWVGNFSEGLAPASTDDGFGFIDHDGNVVVPFRYVSASAFSEGRAAVRHGEIELNQWGNWVDNARWGFIDHYGNEVVPIMYGLVNDFSYGLAAVRDGDWETGRWGFIDKMGNVVVPLMFEDVRSFQEGMAWVRQDGLWGVLQIVGDDPVPGTMYDDFFNARYIYEGAHHTFTPSPELLVQVNNPGTAHTQISSMVAALTQGQRTSGDELNLVTLQIENLARRGTTQNTPAGNRFTNDILRNSAALSGQIHYGVEHILEQGDVGLLRRLRNNINFESDATNMISASFPDDVSGIQFDNFTVESDFAAITLNREHIPVGGEIGLRQVALDDAFDSYGILNRLGRLPGTISDFSSPMTVLSNFWFVLVIVILLIIWIIVAAKGERLRRWVIPVFALLAIITNAALVMWQMEITVRNAVAVIEVNMTQGMRATVSLPANVTDPEFLVLMNENGDVMHSRYNTVTGNIDARISAGGTYFLRHNQLSFADVYDKNQHMQDAILQLASRGIMLMERPGYSRGAFYPDEPITRTELVAAIVRAFDMVDIDAQTTFTDITPDAWYYLAIATAQQEGLISGFRDGTFRGDLNIPKDQLVVMAANALVEQMGYYIPLDIESYLARFHDRDQLASWSEDGIALASSSNVLIHRTDNIFSPRSAMTRGDAAVILYRVFSRVW